MSLNTAHKILITAAILFVLGYAVWEIRHAPGPPGPGAIARGSLAALAALGLLVYLRRFLRSLRRR